MNAASRYSMPSVIGLVIMPSCFVPSILSNSTAKTFDGRGLRTGSAASVMGRPLTMASKTRPYVPHQLLVPSRNPLHSVISAPTDLRRLH